MIKKLFNVIDLRIIKRGNDKVERQIYFYIHYMAKSQFNTIKFCIFRHICIRVCGDYTVQKVRLKQVEFGGNALFKAKYVK